MNFAKSLRTPFLIEHLCTNTSVLGGCVYGKDSIVGMIHLKVWNSSVSDNQKAVVLC